MVPCTVYEEHLKHHTSVDFNKFLLPYIPICIHINTHTQSVINQGSKGGLKHSLVHLLLTIRNCTEI